MTPQESHGEEGQGQGQGQGLLTSTGLALKLRQISPSERRWVQATWSFELRRKRPDRFEKVGRLQVRARMLSRAHTLLVDELMEVADIAAVCLASDMVTPIAWLCFDGTTLHYIHVLPEARRMGVATAVLAGAGFTEASHMTDLGSHLRKYLS